MRNTLTNVVAFAVGAAIGSAVTWKLIKTKYEQIAKEEIESVKETFGRGRKQDLETPESQKDSGAAPDEIVAGQLVIRDYVEKVQDLGYVNYASKAGSKTEPYVIPPEEFGEKSEYTKVSLTYYADKVLADEYDKIITDVGGTVGIDSLNHFGEYEEDSVFVRNDERMTDYEILRDENDYADVVGDRQHRSEDEWDETN